MSNETKSQIVGAIFAGQTLDEVSKRFGCSKVYAYWLFHKMTGQFA